MIEPTDLIGVELGRYSVCASILDSTGTQLLGYADNSILSAEDTYGGDSRFPNPGPALAALWSKLKLDGMSNLRVAVTLGVGHAGIGSGPAIEQWVDSLAVKISDPITKAGDPNTGVSYIPTRHLGTVMGTFQSLGVVPERIELPPVAVVRVIPAVEDYSVSVSSGIGWKARIHQGQVLEAVAYPDGLGKDGVHIEMGGQPEVELPQLEGVQVPSSLLADDRISMATLAVSVGAAKGLLTSGGGNFTTAIGAATVGAAPLAEASTRVAPPVTAPVPAQGPAQFLSPRTAGNDQNGASPTVLPGQAAPSFADPEPIVAEQGASSFSAWSDQETAIESQRKSVSAQVASRPSATGVNNERLSEGATGALDYSADEYTEDRAALYEDQVSPALKALVGFLAVLGVLLLLVLVLT